MVTNRVYKVLETDGTSAASVAALAAHDFVVLKKDNTLAVAGDTIANSDRIQIVVADAAGNRVFSDWIKGLDVRVFEKQVFRAKVEQVVTVTVGTPVVGQQYNLSIIDTSDKEILQCRQAKRVYSRIAVTGDTATTLAADYVAQITADPASIVTASNVAGAITLTAKVVANVANAAGEYPAQYTFEAFSSQVDTSTNGFFQAFGTVVYTTAPDYGSGNFWQVRTLEQRGQGYVGVTNRTKFPVEAGQYLSTLGVNYDVYVIEYANNYSTNSYTAGSSDSPITIVILCTAGAGTALEAILTPYFASTPVEGIGVNG